MHKTSLNAKPDCGLHDFTLRSLQYITSIIEAGNDSSEAQEPTMKAEGKRDVSRQADRILRQKLNGNGGYDMKLQFSRVMPEQKSGIWRKEVNSRLISRSDKQLALPHSLGDRELSTPSPSSLAHLHHHTLKFALTNPSWATLTQHWPVLGHFLHFIQDTNCHNQRP